MITGVSVNKNRREEVMQETDSMVFSHRTNSPGLRCVQKQIFIGGETKPEDPFVQLCLYYGDLGPSSSGLPNMFKVLRDHMFVHWGVVTVKGWTIQPSPRLNIEYSRLCWIGFMPGKLK